MRVRAIGEDERERFDAAVASSPLADVLQSYEWGEIKAASGWDALRLVVEDDEGGIRGSCSVLRTRPARGVPPLLYAPRGPILDTTDDETVRALLDGVRARAGNAFLFKCDPAVEEGAAAAQGLRRAGLRRVSGGGFGGVQPVAVMVLDLTPGTEKIFEGFKSKWRYNIRLAERRGVSVREGSAEDLGPFYEILLETAARDRFIVRGRPYFETFYGTLAPRGMAKLFMADVEGRPVAGILLTCMGERVVYVYGASSNEHRNVMPNHLLQWHAIRWAADNGYKVYDFRGVSPVRDGEPVHPHLAGLNRFKEGFGARYVEYAGEFDLPLRAGWYGLWRTAAPTAIALRKKLKGAPATDVD